MRILAFVAAGGGLGLLGAIALGACGGGSSNNPNSLGFGCSISTGEQICYAYKNISASQQMTLQSSCMQQGGLAVFECPTANLVGCCAETNAGITSDECFYSGTVSVDEMACGSAGGSWSNGNSGLGSSGSSSGGTSGGSSGGGTGAGFGCSIQLAGEQFCYVYSNLSSTEESEEQSACTQESGSMVDTCPTANLVGCCAVSSSGISVDECYYFGTASDDETACTSRAAQGYVFAYSDSASGGTSTASLTADGSACVSGMAVGTICEDQTCYGTHYGAGMGIDVNQAMGTGTTAGNFAATGSLGVTYSVSVLVTGMRLIVGDSTTDYCVEITSLSGMVPWEDFNTACYDPGTGTSLGTAPPASFTSVRFQIPADDTDGLTTNFDFCVDQLSF